MSKEKDSKTSSERVEAAIASRKISLKAFSEQSNIPYPSLKDYAKGKRMPGLEAVIRIALTSGVSGDWLLKGTGPMFPTKPEDLPIQLDKTLFGSIFMAITQAYLEAGGRYESDLEETKATVQTLVRQGVLAAHIYEKVSHLKDDGQRTEMIQATVEEMISVDLSYAETLQKAVLAESPSQESKEGNKPKPSTPSSKYNINTWN